MNPVDPVAEVFAALTPLVLGDRVRLRPRTECTTCWGVRSPQDGTPEDFEGVIGLVIHVGPAGESHRYTVRLAQGRFDLTEWECDRMELEPIGDYDATENVRADLHHRKTRSV